MTSRGPFRPKTFYDSMILWRVCSITWLPARHSEAGKKEENVLEILDATKQQVQHFSGGSVLHVCHFKRADRGQDWGVTWAEPLRKGSQDVLCKSSLSLLHQLLLKSSTLQHGTSVLLRSQDLQSPKCRLCPEHQCLILAGTLCVNLSSAFRYNFHCPQLMHGLWS